MWGAEKLCRRLSYEIKIGVMTAFIEMENVGPKREQS